MQGGIIDKDMPIARVATSRCCARKGKPTRVGYQLRRRRHEGPHLPSKCGADLDERRPTTATAHVPRLQAALQRRDPRAAQGAARPRQRHAGAAAREDRHQHGRRPGHAAAVAARGRRRRPHASSPARSRSSPRPRSRSPASSSARATPIGAKVTLRGDRMWEFLDRLISLAIPRIRDFRGLPANSVRRPRQLHVRRHRAADLPGDRLRQGRRDPGHGHHDRDHRPHRRRGQGAARRLRLPVQA